LEVALPRGALLGDGAAVELFLHDLHDDGNRVEPFDEAVSRLAIGETGVELVPDLELASFLACHQHLPLKARREAGDFAVTCFHTFTCCCVSCLFER